MQINKTVAQLNIENLRNPIDFNPQITQIFLQIINPQFGSGLSGLGYLLWII